MIFYLICEFHEKRATEPKFVTQRRPGALLFATTFFNPQQMSLSREKFITQGWKWEASTKTCKETVARKVKVFSISHFAALRLAFTSDGVVVGVIIRSVDRCDLVKIKPTESEAERCIRLWLRRLRSSENCIVRVASRSRRVNQSQCSIRGPVIGWVFRFCFRLRQSSFH